jgi:acyl-CoA thioesterase-1
MALGAARIVACVARGFVFLLQAGGASMLTVAVFFASGAAFFSGAACLLAGLFALSWGTRTFSKTAGRVLIALGIFQIVMSATPLPLWAYAIWGFSVLAWIVAIVPRNRASRRLRTAAIVISAGCTLGAAVWELRYQLPPQTLYGHWSRLVVIGDSLSAEEFTEGGDPWPTLLAHDHGVVVDNLAFNGAQAASAEKKIAAEQLSDALVLLEIGGNDILGATSTTDFNRYLERLLKKVCRSDNSVVMLELPLPPLYNRYGEIQRHLASAYQVHTIPKREFASVIAGDQATLDGLHFSGAGHRKMAAMIWKHVSSALRRAP